MSAGAYVCLCGEQNKRETKVWKEKKGGIKGKEGLGRLGEKDQV